MKSRFKLEFSSICIIAILLVSSVTSFAVSYDYTNQNVTTYVAPSGSLTASGATPEVGHVAVHPITWGSHTNPIFPFGAFIVTDEELPVPNASDEMSLFQVQDIGDVYNAKGLSRYWFDIYIGINTNSNIQKAENFGKKIVDYTVSW